MLRLALLLCSIALSSLPACVEPHNHAELTAAEANALRALANPADPPPDHSNHYVDSDAAAELGRKLYFDPDFSGPATGIDMLYREVDEALRAGKGERTGISCNTCHDVTRGGGADGEEFEDIHVGVGGGVYDVNGQQSFNAAYLPLLYWNGRNDSLWSQILAVTESPVSMAGSRLRVAWRIADAYRDEYAAVFGDYPLAAQFDSIAAQRARLEADGSCKLVDDQCPSTWCHPVMAAGGTCMPRFPLEGRPGFTGVGAAVQCQLGATDPLHAPNGDAYDCMEVADQLTVTRVYVNFAKAIAAYEYRLKSQDSDFDRWVASGFATGMPSAQAVEGAKLFVGKAGCSHCHSGPLLSDGQFHNIGVPQFGEFVPKEDDCPQGGVCDCVTDDAQTPNNCLPWGYRDGLRKLQANKFRRDSRWSDDVSCQAHQTVHTDANYAMANPDECDGRVAFYSAPLTDTLKGTWRTPSLRDVALTAPYMHDGVYDELDEVVAHYNDAGLFTYEEEGEEEEDEEDEPEQVGSVGRQMVPLFLDEREQAALVAFLKTLTGRPDPRWTTAPELPPSSAF